MPQFMFHGNGGAARAPHRAAAGCALQLIIVEARVTQCAVPQGCSDPSGILDFERILNASGAHFAVELSF